jgi:hypothetical protein
MIYYGEGIRKAQKELQLPVDSFPDLGIWDNDMNSRVGPELGDSTNEHYDNESYSAEEFSCPVSTITRWLLIITITVGTWAIITKTRTITATTCWPLVIRRHWREWAPVVCLNVVCY